MLRLLHPAALWTLATLALPLVVHLRRPPPRTVRLGSLRFLENTPRRPLRNLRWREILLLCTRMGLLAALVLLLAAPRWIVSPPSGPRRWALLDPTAAPAGESLQRWRDLKRAGYELRDLAPGFPTAPDDPKPAAEDGTPPDTWSLLREADAGLPAGSTLTVFSPGRLAALRGARPLLGHCKVEWCITADVDAGAPHLWVAQASQTHVWVGRSEAQATTFAAAGPYAGFAFASHPDEQWKIETRELAGEFSARIIRGAGQPPPWTAVKAAAGARSVLILHDAEHVSDARYIEAAVRAVTEITGQPLNLQTREITADVENAPATDWTFWLSQSAVPDGLVARAPRIVCYAGEDARDIEDSIVAPDAPTAEGVRVWKVAARRDSPGTVLWRDAQGDPLLTYSRMGSGEQWDFFSRFNPAWTDLPQTSALPAWICQLLFPDFAARSDIDANHDRRLIDPAQCSPSEGSLKTATVLPLSADAPSHDLHWPLCALAALLFFAERVLSLRRPLDSPAPVTAPARELSAALP